MLRYRLAVLASALCFSTTGTAQALGPAGTNPIGVGAFRLLVGGLGLLAVTWWTTGRHSVAGSGLATRLGLPTGPGAAAAAWRAGLAVAGYQVCFFLAVRTTGVAVGTVVTIGSAPVITGALAWAAGHGRPDRRWAVATVLAATGLAVLVAGGRQAHVSALGVALALVAAAAYSGMTVASKSLLARGAGAESAMAAVFGAGAVWLLPVFLVVPVGWAASPRGLALVLWLGLVPTTLAYVLFARGLVHLSAAEVTTLVLAEPLTAAVLGVVLLGEPVGPTTVAGAALIVGGLALAAVRRDGARPRPVPAGAGA